MNDPAKILVVDDDPAILRLIQVSLSQRGYAVILAESGRAAVDLARRETPDLILLDVVLPEMDGREACRRIKGEARGFVPVILVTVQSDVKDKVSARELGADDYLTKPFVLEELHARVRSMLRIKALYDEQERASTIDAVTGLYNRRYLDRRLAEECDRIARYGGFFTCWLIDLDHFKRVNDTRGHPEGDRVLAAFAGHVRDRLRRTDVVARYGGEEFVVILPETDLVEAAAMADQLRASIEARRFPDPTAGEPLTCSIGVCRFPSAAAGNREALVACLDEALYAAKKAGRNRVNVVAAPPLPRQDASNQ